jgi:NADH:ubiquinone reductase (H+-translocating)
MLRRDAYALVNLSLPRKLLSSLGLLAGAMLFVGGVALSVLLTNWHLTLSGFLGWGGMLMRVRSFAGPWFYALFAAHLLSLLLVGTVSFRLFRRVALPRRMRAFVTAVLVVLAVADVACWLLLPMLSLARALLGPVLLGLGLGLAYLVLRPLRDMWLFVRWKAPQRAEPSRVVIVGGGFAGLYTAMELDRLLGHHRGVEIVVLDKRNYFLFPPLLPSVATGAIETRQVTYPFRRIFEATNIVFRKETVETVDLSAKVVHTRADVDETAAPCHRALSYDLLVLAPGSDTQTFRTPGVAENAFFMRELGDAVAVRNHIIDCFELAAQESSAERRARLLRFVVVGGGPTGVELVAEIRDLIEHVLFLRYPEVHRGEVELILVQSAPKLLPGWHPTVVDHATNQLERLRVRVLTGRKVQAVGDFSVTLDGDEVLGARTCVWCAGVKPARLLSAVDLPKHPSGRIPVEEDLRVAGHPAVFVLGDASLAHHAGKPLPPLGQVAFQQGTQTGRNIARLLRGLPPKPFRYFNYGALVSVGEHFAAVDLLGVRISGALAWFVWRSLYLTKLVGFGNRVRVILDWTLDLLVERSISQISATRQDLRAASDDANHVTLRAGAGT